MKEAGVRCAGCLDGDKSLITSFSFLFIYFASFRYSLKPFFFSLFFKALHLFYSLKPFFFFSSLKSQSSDLHCPMFCLAFLYHMSLLKVLVLRLADTQQQPSPAASQAANFTSSQPHPPSVSLLYTVENKQVEQ
jgi:hypothetical protein